MLIITVICLLFSSLAYHGLSFEMRRGLRNQAFRFDRPREDIQVFEDVRKAVLLRLLIINVAILFFSGFAAYFLAGKTLKPIEEMLEDQKRFVADASHELRTPLTAIKTETEVALREKNIGAVNIKKLLISNLEEINRMQNLTNNLLALSRYQKISSDIKFESLNLKNLLNKAIAVVKPIAIKKKIEITCKLATDLHIKGDSSSLAQLFTIILDNAVKYNRSGGKVQIRAAKTDGRIQIEIKDHGVGIKTTELPFIFDRFYRADSSRSKTETDGFGLGLSIAKEIVGLHHGHIKVESEVGKGTIVKIIL